MNTYLKWVIIQNSIIVSTKHIRPSGYTDTTFVCNKLGEDLVSYNPQVKKHKTSKISIISDDFNIHISIKIDTGSKHDVTILKEQLIEFSNSHPLLCNENNTIVADGAYDSNPLHKLVKELITNKNIRNLKDKTKIKLNKYDKMLLKNEYVLNIQEKTVFFS